eukprot:9707523-Ditylum_brightwellii.AAC.1
MQWCHMSEFWTLVIQQSNLDQYREDPTTSLGQVSGTKALHMPAGAKPAQTKVGVNKKPGHHDGAPIINWWCKGLEVFLHLWA